MLLAISFLASVTLVYASWILRETRSSLKEQARLIDECYDSNIGRAHYCVALATISSDRSLSRAQCADMAAEAIRPD